MLDGRIRVHPPVRASTYDQVLREAVADILEVVQDESVSIWSVRQPRGHTLLEHFGLMAPSVPSRVRCRCSASIRDFSPSATS